MSEGLNEEYPKRPPEEMIEKLRAQMRVAAEAKAAGISTMSCPRCGGSLNQNQFEGVMIDTCENCGGIWLDSGELEQLLKCDTGSWLCRRWFAEGQ